MPLSSKELSILPDDIIFTHSNLQLVMSLREDDESTIRAYVGQKVGDVNKSAFYWAFDNVNMEAGYEQWMADRGFLAIMNREIQAVYGSFSANEELLWWEKFARFCKENLLFDSAAGFKLRG